MRDEILTTRQLAERLDVTPETIRRWVRRGLIPEIRITSKARRFDCDAVMLALAARANGGGAK